MQTMTQSLTAVALASLLGFSSCASSGAPLASSQPAPAAARATYADINGKAHNLGASLDAGRQVALVFWQPWCGSCKAEAPIASAAAKTFSANMDVIGVVSGPEGEVDADAMKQALFSWGMSYPTIRDTDMELTYGFDVQGVPTIIIIDPDGTVTYRSHAAPAEWGHGPE